MTMAGKTAWRSAAAAPATKPRPEATATVQHLPNFKPSTPEELERCLSDPVWRVCSGQLYKIMVKQGDDESIVPFVPNRAQRRLLTRLWHRNIILKARQLGFTTLVAILWLDHALFNSDQRCGIIAQDREAAEVIFRDKVKLAYNHLPPEIRAARPLARDSATELLFSNNSSIRVATSMRSGTIHRLHVSEFGKICAQFPDKAKEVVTGSLPAVPLDGISIIESTAEGQDGDFYKMTNRAIETLEAGKDLTPRDYRFHFFPWWDEPAYRIDTASVMLTPKDREYFEQVEAETGTKLDDQQRFWYVATRDADFSGDPEKMWQEYPSTAKEAFQVSTEGTYYAVQLTAARKAGRICSVPYVEGTPVNTFWDVGSTDGTAIWFHQRVGFDDRFINFIEGWGEPYAHFISKMQQLGYVWGTHYLPHDAGHKRQQGMKVASPMEELEGFKLGGTWEIVPPVDDVNHGIQKTRAAFGRYWFDEERTKVGLAHIAGYKKRWNKASGGWSSTPRKDDGNSEAADALRQHGQGYMPPGRPSTKQPVRTTWRTS
jgi:hypothetical protein